jgi:hypothetical protein
MKRRRNVAWLVAVAVGLMLIPATGAMAASKHEKKQNAAIGKASKAAARALARTAALTTTVGDQTKSLADLQTSTTGIDNRLKAIEAGVPQVLDGLTKLQAAALALKSGLETAGAGLTTLGDAYKAVEYGRAGIFAGDADLTIAAGGAVTSADIPDDGNAITTGEDAIVVAGAGATNESLNLRAAIRSNESDGDDAAETAGQAGGYIFIVDNDTGVRAACIGAPNPPGIFGTTPGDPIVTPSGTNSTLPLKNIPGGVLRTDTAKPDATSTSLLPAPCTFAATPGHTYEVHYSVNFLDIPTSATPGPKE